MNMMAHVRKADLVNKSANEKENALACLVNESNSANFMTCERKPI